MKQLLVIVAIAAAGCGAGTAHMTAPNEVPKSQDVPTASLVESSTAFGLDLYQQLRTRSGNLFLSPYSIYTGLAMTYAGARGDTATQMAAVMHLPPGDDRVHAMSATLAATLFNLDRPRTQESRSCPSGSTANLHFVPSCGPRTRSGYKRDSLCSTRSPSACAETMGPLSA